MATLRLPNGLDFLSLIFAHVVVVRDAVNFYHPDTSSGDEVFSLPLFRFASLGLPTPILAGRKYPKTFDSVV